MPDRSIPHIFKRLLAEGCMDESELFKTSDGFFVGYKSVADLLSAKDILDFPDPAGERLACKNFYDDWFLYAVPEGSGYTYSLLKLREQEHDAEEEAPADGDTPGVTVSFISFDGELLLGCLAEPSDENRRKLNAEINRVVAYKGQRHHPALKRYFEDPRSRGAYLTARLYVRKIASMAEDGCVAVPEYYKELVRLSRSYKNSGKFARLPQFIAGLNQEVGRIICDDERIYLGNPEEPTEEEAAAILATHTGNTSAFSFAAEVEYHARFLTPLAKIKLPFFGRSIYDSAVRADMTVHDTEFEGPAPFYRADSKIVRRQTALHATFRF